MSALRTPVAIAAAAMAVLPAALLAAQAGVAGIESRLEAVT